MEPQYKPETSTLPQQSRTCSVCSPTRTIFVISPGTYSKTQCLQVGDANLLQSLKATFWTEWEDADLWPVLVYLRGSKHLRLSPWKEVMPAARFGC